MKHRLIDDIFNGLKNEYKDSVEALESLRELSEDIQEDSKRIHIIIDNFIEDKAIELDLCPKCFAELESKTHNNETVEYMGTEIKMPTFERACLNCGIIE